MKTSVNVMWLNSHIRKSNVDVTRGNLSKDCTPKYLHNELFMYTKNVCESLDIQFCLMTFFLNLTSKLFLVTLSVKILSAKNFVGKNFYQLLKITSLFVDETFYQSI